MPSKSLAQTVTTSGGVPSGQIPLPAAALSVAERWLSALQPGRGDAAVLAAALRELMLRVCHRALAARQTFIHAVRSTTGGDEWRALSAELLCADPQLDVASQARWAEIGAAPLLDGLDAVGDACVGSPSCGVEAALCLGATYEALLGVEPVAVELGWVELKPEGAWVDLRRLVALPPTERGSWLRRTARLSKERAVRLSARLSEATTWEQLADALRAVTRRRADAPRWVLARSPGRRSAGAHYTPARIARAVVARALDALPPETYTRGVRICDPAAGSGAFLVCAAAWLADRLAQPSLGKERVESHGETLRHVVERCLFGLDRDPGAVLATRLSLTLLCGEHAPGPAWLRSHFACGDALLGCDPYQWRERRIDVERGGVSEPVAVTESGRRDADALIRDALTRPQRARHDDDVSHTDPIAGDPSHWPALFPEIFERDAPGFDAIIGNPPWVAYVGRAAQPLPPALRAYYEAINPGFRGYRTLHGMFVHRSAVMLRPGGRLGLVLPTSVADLDGYGPTRRAHDELCAPDEEMPDFGDGAFEGVFQPCMALVSTRRDVKITAAGEAWTLERRDIDADEQDLLRRLGDLSPLEPTMFGERGYQTTGGDLSRLREGSASPGPDWVALQQGSDVAQFELRPPRLYANPQSLQGRMREADDWAKVDVLIRQTARYPIAALASGHAFRNSLVAGFRSEQITPEALVCYLNSSLVRWLHYVRFRDARQGMPQLKIGHLRALPDFPTSSRATWSRLHELGTKLARPNAGITPADRTQLDDAVFDGFRLTRAQRHVVLRWAERMPPPEPRRTRAQRS